MRLIKSESFYLLTWDYIIHTVVITLIIILKAVRLLRAWYMQVKGFICITYLIFPKLDKVNSIMDCEDGK